MKQAALLMPRGLFRFRFTLADDQRYLLIASRVSSATRRAAAV